MRKQFIGASYQFRITQSYLFNQFWCIWELIWLLSLTLSKECYYCNYYFEHIVLWKHYFACLYLCLDCSKIVLRIKTRWLFITILIFCITYNEIFSLQNKNRNLPNNNAKWQCTNQLFCTLVMYYHVHLWRIHYGTNRYLWMLHIQNKSYHGFTSRTVYS